MTSDKGQSSMEFLIVTSLILVLIVIALGFVSEGPDSAIQIVKNGFSRFMNAISLAY